ncbi:hypothetical protein JM83_1087 [Gillisia sp. Hel_I_86]|uniref:hypothetical protein n=1 Tax=Gillisia sp. Hel_I_86 TaxID=1249981 RepID=UPI00119BB145|nr:hypothetical protein [Gillisia sp. Hel_I_86]TVZ26137.1 hypothetical protein JM83_1087 [Gillisia sp. Hel_I_86]
MKNIKIIIGIALILLVSVQCSTSDDGTTSVETPLSENLNAVLNVSNNNSGNVTITPTAEGAVSFEVNFGDGSGSEAPAVLKPGERVTHSYAEGEYTMSINAINIAGEKTTYTYPLSVVYRAPENLAVSPNVDGYNLTISAEADYANSFTVYYGDIEGEEGTPMAVGETLPPHTYAESGIYDVRVVANSGGAATSETVVPVGIYDPFILPVTFEDFYFFGTFGDGTPQEFSTVDNPDPSGINTSAKAGLFTNGQSSWSGTYSPLAEPIDFSQGQVITMMVYTADPADIGKKVNMELEWPDGASEGQPYGAIVKAPITKSGEWELLTFDFSGIESIPDGAKFNQLVFRFNDSAEGTEEKIYFDDITLNN